MISSSSSRQCHATKRSPSWSGRDIRDAAKEAVKFADLLVVCSFASSVIKQGAVITS